MSTRVYSFFKNKRRLFVRSKILLRIKVKEARENNVLKNFDKRYREMKGGEEKEEYVLN